MGDEQGEYEAAIRVFRDSVNALRVALSSEPTPDVIYVRAENVKRAVDALDAAYGNYWFWRERQAEAGREGER